VPFEYKKPQRHCSKTFISLSEAISRRLFLPIYLSSVAILGASIIPWLREKNTHSETLSVSRFEASSGYLMASVESLPRGSQFCAGLFRSTRPDNDINIFINERQNRAFYRGSMQ
jgi:hypothetical protein